MKQRDQPPPLLQYDVTTAPSPVNISSANDPVSAQIIIGVGANINVNCRYIVFQVPIGDAATDMYVVSPSPIASCDNPDWALTDDVLPDVNSSDANYKTFIFKHGVESMAVNSALVITIEGTVNSTGGIAVIQIKENSTLINDGNYMWKQKTQDISKTAEEALFLNSVIMAYLRTPGVPAALPDKNKGVQLTWQSNGDYFRVYAGSELSPVFEGEDKQFVIPEGLATDIVFIVEAVKNESSVYQQYVAKIKAPGAVFSDLSVTESLDISQVFFNAFNFTTIQYASYPPNMPYFAGGDGFLIVNIDASMEPAGTNINLNISIGDATCTAPNITTKIIPVRKSTSFYIQPFGFGDAKVNYYWIGVGDSQLIPGVGS